MYFSVLNFCLLLPGGGGVDVQTPPWPCTDCGAAQSPPGADALLPQPCWQAEGEGEGWLAGLVSAGGGPGRSSSLLPLCTSVGLKEGEPSPASHAWFPLIDVRCKLPFVLGGCGDLVTHQVLLTLKTGMGGQWVTIPVCCHLLLPGAGQVQLPASPPPARGKGDSLWLVLSPCSSALGGGGGCVHARMCSGDSPSLLWLPCCLVRMEGQRPPGDSGGQSSLAGCSPQGHKGGTRLSN